MKLINFVITTEQLKGCCIKNMLWTLEMSGIIKHWSFIYQGLSKGAPKPYYFVCVSALKPSWLVAFLDERIANYLMWPDTNEKEMLLYMMRHGECNIIDVHSNFNIQKVVNS